MSYGIGYYAQRLGRLPSAWLVDVAGREREEPIFEDAFETVSLATINRNVRSSRLAMNCTSACAERPRARDGLTRSWLSVEQVVRESLELDR